MTAPQEPEADSGEAAPASVRPGSSANTGLGLSFAYAAFGWLVLGVTIFFAVRYEAVLVRSAIDRAFAQRSLASLIVPLTIELVLGLVVFRKHLQRQRNSIGRARFLWLGFRKCALAADVVAARHQTGWPGKAVGAGGRSSRSSSADWLAAASEISPARSSRCSAASSTPTAAT